MIFLNVEISLNVLIPASESTYKGFKRFCPIPNRKHESVESRARANVMKQKVQNVTLKKLACGSSNRRANFEETSENRIQAFC